MFKSSTSRVSLGFRVVHNGKSRRPHRQLTTPAEGAAKPSATPTNPPSPPPPTPKKGGVFFKLFGLTTVGVGGVIGYAWYDAEFKKLIEENVPYSKDAFDVIFPYFPDIQSFKTVEPPVPSKKLEPIATDVPKKKVETSQVEKTAQPSKPTPPPKPTPKQAEQTKEKEINDKAKQKEAVARKLKEKEANEAAENAALEVIIENLIENNTKFIKSAVEAQQKVVDYTKAHTQALKKAMDDTSQILDKDKQWEAVADAFSIRESTVQEANRISDMAKENLEKLKKTIDDSKKDAVLKKNKILKTAQQKLNEFNNDINTVLSQVKKEESEARVMTKYKDLVDKGRQQFKKELESIMPDVKIGDKKGKKLSEDELNSLIAHAHRRIDQLQKQLAEQLAHESQRIDKALQIQRVEDEKIAQTRVGLERQRLRDQFSLEKDKWEEDARVEFEQELRQHLARQAAAHSDHLKDVLKIQEGEIAQQYERVMHTRLIEERQTFQSEVAGWIARLKGIETAVDARAENEKTARIAQELWLACIAMNGVIRLGKEGGTSGEEKLQPLSKEAVAISEAAGKHPFVQTVLQSVPEEALMRGVWTEDSLKERFPKVKRICKRVAMIDENGGTLFRYFLSYFQSFFIFNSVYAKSDSDSIEISELDTFNILAHADYFLEKGDLLQAVRFMNQLQGEPRRVASDWLKEAKLLLETRQAAYALTAFASASGLGTIF
ncbi:hypothetical protein SNE40_007805 [Patella caerulea]|uniref:MICOS complex subunit MIC60 n=1 Tax=Patella caerulea TaxID=87958 RepID=A0AAN8PVL2_PATCE